MPQQLLRQNHIASCCTLNGREKYPDMFYRDPSCHIEQSHGARICGAHLMLSERTKKRTKERTKERPLRAAYGAVVTQLSGLCQVGHSTTSPPMVPRGLFLGIPHSHSLLRCCFFPPNKGRTCQIPGSSYHMLLIPPNPRTTANTSLHTSPADRAHVLSSSLSHLPAASPFPKDAKVRTHIIVSSQ